MRTLVSRCVAVVSLCALSTTLLAAPRPQQPRDRTERPIKRIVRALGDLITVPIPRPQQP